tara:strand:- start:1806 stop:2543 length:738 start_codon:yes stop_codon:yes gene_type:complete
VGLDETLLLFFGGLLAGVINTLAGGGSLITVPLLIFAGVPGGAANGSNRVGILTSSASAVMAFKSFGVSGISKAIPILLPISTGSIIGALIASNLGDEIFEKIFGIMMIPILLLSLRPSPKLDSSRSPWRKSFSVLIFLLVGLYGGAFQAGIGLLLVLSLARSGLDLVLANSVKVVVTLIVSIFALPVFIFHDQVYWKESIVLATGLTIGAIVGARFAVLGGASLIRKVLFVAVIAFSGRLLNLY